MTLPFAVLWVTGGEKQPGGVTQEYAFITRLAKSKHVRRLVQWPVSHSKAEVWMASNCTELTELCIAGVPLVVACQKGTNRLYETTVLATYYLVGSLAPLTNLWLCRAMSAQSYHNMKRMLNTKRMGGRGVKRIRYDCSEEGHSSSRQEASADIGRRLSRCVYCAVVSFFSSCAHLCK